jgi:hypothetical protein
MELLGEAGSFLEGGDQVAGSLLEAIESVLQVPAIIRLDMRREAGP